MSREELLRNQSVEEKNSLHRALKIAGALGAAALAGLAVLAVSGSPELTASSLIVGGTVAAAAGMVATHEK